MASGAGRALTRDVSDQAQAATAILLRVPARFPEPIGENGFRLLRGRVLYRENALRARIRDLVVEDGVAEADRRRIRLGVGVNDARYARPMRRGQTHRAG